jgi:hypothetical protein
MNVSFAGILFVLPLGIPAGMAVFAAAPGLVIRAAHFIFVK